MLLLFASPGAQASQQHVHDITELDLEDLLNIEITSVSRRTQSVSDAATAVYVITAEDIRRTGVTTLPDALRLAPGVHVMQMDGNKWAIGIRGFTGRFSSKLLVMIDGRSIYSPIFAGVHWEANDVLLEDIDRIEVIRGPGATMWGSNAVSGVINIITKPVRETQGVVATAGGGNQEGGFGSARFGGAVGSQLQYRFYSKYNSRSGQLLSSGDRANDNWRKMQGGFRMDWSPSQNDEVVISGDGYEGDGGERFQVPLRQAPFQELTPYRTSFSGTNVLSRWTHRHSERSLTQVQVYFDRSVRDNLLERDTSHSLADAEVQHEREFSVHRLVFGAGYRVSRDNTPTEWFGRFDPSRRTLQRMNTFVQGEIALVPDKFILTVGSKFENNTFTDWVVQPSASLLWNVTERDALWFSASRASKTPSRANRDLIFDTFTAPGPQGSLILGQVLGSDEVESEHLKAFEGGYRFSPVSNLSFDVTAFYDAYTNLIHFREDEPTYFLNGTQPTTVIPLVQANLGERNIYGAELAASWRASEAGRLRLSYSWLRGGVDSEADVAGPAHILHARWFWNLPGDVEWDSSYFFVDNYATIRAYHRVDTRLAWRPASHWELSVVGQHLLDNQHLESPALFVAPTEVGRSIYVKASWLF
jgi:iron complex outermembrane receptor protein